ncbi:hypothetical protein V8E51_016884 [Hyaloscypha variabilis]
MVGVKTWEDDQITLILTCKEQGKSVKEILSLLKARWPRKEVKDSGVRYVMTNYKDFKIGPRSKSMAGTSKSRNSQAGAGHVSHNRPYPKQARTMSKRVNPPPPLNSRTHTSLYSPPAPLSPNMDKFAFAAQMRQIAGGSITASLEIPQPFNILNGPVQSTTELLAHAEQANNLGVDAIERGRTVSPSPGSKSIMASPAPQAAMTVPQAYAAIQGGIQQHDMQRTISMPTNFHYNQQIPAQVMQMYGQQGQTGPQSMHVKGQQGQQMQLNGQQGQHMQVNGQNGQHGQIGAYMQMNGQQQHMMGPMFYVQPGLPVSPSYGANIPQYQGYPQIMTFQQGQPGGMGVHGGPGTFNGLPAMPLIGYSPYTGSLPSAATPQRRGMIPQGTPFNPQLNAAQVSTPIHQNQRHIDPLLRSMAPSRVMQTINNPGTMGLNGSRPPTRNGISATPQQNHNIGQQLSHGASTASGFNIRGNPTRQGPGLESSLATTQSSRNNQPTVQQAQNGPVVAGNRSATPRVQAPHGGQAATLQNDNMSQGTINSVPNGAASRVSQSPNSHAHGSESRTELERNPSVGSAPPSPTNPIVVIFEDPIFETPFEVPASLESLRDLIWEHMNGSVQRPGEYVPSPQELDYMISTGRLVCHFKRPVFRQGMIWKENPQPYTPPNSEGRSNTSVQGLGASTASEQCDKPESDCAQCPHNASRTSTSPLAQQQSITGPKTPPTRPVTSSTTQVTPDVSSMKLTNAQQASTPAAKPPVQPGSGQENSRQLCNQNTSGTSSNSRPSGKRAAPPSEQGGSPSKRRKSCTQDSSNPTRQPHFTVTKEGFDGRLEFATPTYPLAELRTFAEKVAGRPIPNGPHTLPSDHYQQRKSIGDASSPTFNPRPSRPLKSSAFFTSPHRQYSASLQESMKQHIPNAVDYGQANSSIEPRATVGTLSNVQDFPFPGTQDGLPAPLAQHVDAQANPSIEPRENLEELSNALGYPGTPDGLAAPQSQDVNASINQQPQEYVHPGELLGDPVATREDEEPQNGGNDIDSLFNQWTDFDQYNMGLNLDMDNTDLNNIFDTDNNTTAGKDCPIQDPNASTSSTSASASNPSPITPQAEPTLFDPFDDEAPWGDEELQKRYRQESAAAAAAPKPVEMVHVPGLSEPVKKGSLMEGFGKNLSG